VHTDVPIDKVEARSYEIPTDQPEADGTLSWSSTTVVVALVTAAGETGLGWTYGADASRALIAGKLSGVIDGGDAMSVTALNESMVRACRNLGRPGAAAHAIAAVDVALWDLKARLLGISLAALLGPHRRTVPAYGSGGFTTYDDKTTTVQLEHWVGDLGVGACKIKVGEDWGRRVERDLSRVGLAREVVGDAVELMVDANGAYPRKVAVRFGRRASEEHGVIWFEEPVSSDDLTGLKEVKDLIEADVTAGEYGYHLPYFAHMLAEGAVDCLQMDATRCGGYTGWLAAAALAQSHNLEVSAHCGPNIHAPVAAAVPNLRHDRR
jgi:L-alanine-DL-glutamate epimerase-like enolase superfamily enzyme